MERGKGQKAWMREWGKRRMAIRHAGGGGGGGSVNINSEWKRWGKIRTPRTSSSSSLKEVNNERLLHLATWNSSQKCTWKSSSNTLLMSTWYFDWVLLAYYFMAPEISPVPLLHVRGRTRRRRRQVKGHQFPKWPLSAETICQCYFSMWKNERGCIKLITCNLSYLF